MLFQTHALRHVNTRPMKRRPENKQTYKVQSWAQAGEGQTVILFHIRVDTVSFVYYIYLIYVIFMSIRWQERIPRQT